MEKSKIAVIGLAVMGENLALNLASRGARVSVYNRSAEKTQRFAAGRGAIANIVPCYSLQELVSSLETPRRILLMVKAGSAVDEMMVALMPLLEAGDLLIDGGNSDFRDTARRTETARQAGLLYIGCGISGGEEGALRGPAMMPGGCREAWPLVKPLFQAASAKAADGSPCCEWIGEGGAGHFVKMVHNGIEYGDMQLICESYQLMRDALGMENDEMSAVLDAWDGGELESYLIRITADILAFREENGEAVLDFILDKAGQKGTGKLAAISALEMGTPLTLIAEAVSARSLSAMRETRKQAAALFGGSIQPCAEKAAVLADLEKALYAAKLISYAQGFALLRDASEAYGWALDLGQIALLWRSGCIIRSGFLNHISEAYGRNAALENLLLDEVFANTLRETQGALRRVLALAIQAGVPMPAFSAAMSYFDSLRCEKLPANLLQAQRDYFGAHTYARIDRPETEHFHSNWTGRGGATVSGSYEA